MQAASTLARRAMTLGAPQAAPVVLDDTAVQIVNRLFDQICAIKTGWRQAWPNDQALARAKREYVKAFMRQGITSLEQVGYGLEVCRADPSDWPPSSGKFVAWCTPSPERLSLPPEEHAYWEAVRNSHPTMMGHESWSHLAVYHAANRCSMHSLRMLPTDVSRAKFAKAYADVRRDLVQGVELPAPQKALPAEVMRKGDPGKARDALAAMRSTLGAQ